ncbi:PsiF family protein [Rhodoplanes sp. TEM]|uniref:PsiF family protein n=1 Tax=Rhodoplanes sp. TEM TaxID=3025489 RepID=UPI0023505823|nr:PsiF family protein [Rhodoplanes sp. TEM]
MTTSWAAAVAAAVLLVAAVPAAAQETKPATEAKPAAEKKVSAQQQRMKDCAAKWKDEKKAKDVKGREAYRTFMRGCLKG